MNPEAKDRRLASDEDKIKKGVVRKKNVSKSFGSKLNFDPKFNLIC